MSSGAKAWTCIVDKLLTYRKHALESSIHWSLCTIGQEEEEEEECHHHT